MNPEKRALRVTELKPNDKIDIIIPQSQEIGLDQALHHYQEGSTIDQSSISLTEIPSHNTTQKSVYFSTKMPKSLLDSPHMSMCGYIEDLLTSKMSDMARQCETFAAEMDIFAYKSEFTQMKVSNELKKLSAENVLLTRENRKLRDTLLN